MLEDILAKLMADPIIKMIGEPGQRAIKILEQELAEKAAKIKTTEDVVQKWWKYGFLVLVLGKNEYGTVIGNLAVQLTTPEDPEGYDEIIQAKDSSFDWSNREKKHVRKVIEYKKFLGVEESIKTLMLQVVEEPYLETLK